MKKLNKANMSRYTMGIALASIWLLMTILTGGTFLTTRNLSNLFLQTATTAVLACGMVLILVSGNIDLSVGSLAGLCGGVAAVCMVKFHMSTPVVLLITLAVGLVAGLWHGFWIAYRGVPAMIVTLASMLVFRGVVIGITGGSTIGPTNDSFKAIGQGYLPPWLGYTVTVLVVAAIIYSELKNRSSKKKYGMKLGNTAWFVTKLVLMVAAVVVFFGIMLTYRGIPIAIMIVLVLAVILNYIGEHTPFGRHIYAIGGNNDAARFSGINIRKTLFALYAGMGVITAVAGVIFTARLNSGSPAAGTNFEMDAIASAIIGGTSTVGGEGRIFGALIGALVMTSIDNGMSLLNLDVTFQYIIKGLVLLAAVAVDVANRRKAGNS